MLWFDCWYLDNLCTYKQVSGHEDYKVWYENRWMWLRSVNKEEVKPKKGRGGGEQNKEEEEREIWKSVWSVLSAISDSLLQWNPHDSCNNNMLCEDLACCRELFQQLARSTVPRGNEIIMITMVQILQGILNILIAIFETAKTITTNVQSTLQRQVGPCATTPSSTCLSWQVHSNDTDTHKLWRTQQHWHQYVDKASLVNNPELQKPLSYLPTAIRQPLQHLCLKASSEVLDGALKEWMSWSTCIVLPSTLDFEDKHNYFN